MCRLHHFDDTHPQWRLRRGEALEEFFGSFDEVFTQRHIDFLFYLFARAFLRELRGHEDVLDNRTQNVGIRTMGRSGGHGCREEVCRGGE